MAGNFFAFFLLLALACYATMGGRNENVNLSEEHSVTEQSHEDVEFLIEELENEGENVAEVVEEEIELGTSEELVEEIPETPLECGIKKAKRYVSRESAPRCSYRSKASPALCPCAARQDAVEEILSECPAKIAKKPIRLIKRTIKKVPASSPCNAKETEAETCEAQPVVEEELAVEEKTHAEVKPKQKAEKTTKVDTAGNQEEKSVKIAKTKQGKSNKQKNQQKTKYQNNKQSNNERGQKNKNSNKKNTKSNKKQSKQ